jgi:hypothetical protein
MRWTALLRLFLATHRSNFEIALAGAPQLGVFCADRFAASRAATIVPT